MDATAVRTWLEGLGLQASSRAGATGEEVTFGPQGSVDHPGVVRWRTPTLMDVYHGRRIPTAALTTQWRDPGNQSTPTAELRAAVDHVARNFPLIVGDVSEDEGAAVVHFSAVLFDEQLSRQAFALTVSSVLKAAEVFEIGSTARAEQLAVLTEIQARQAGPQVPPPPPPPPATTLTWQPGNGGRA